MIAGPAEIVQATYDQRCTADEKQRGAGDGGDNAEPPPHTAVDEGQHAQLEEHPCGDATINAAYEKRQPCHAAVKRQIAFKKSVHVWKLPPRVMHVKIA